MADAPRDSEDTLINADDMAAIREAAGYHKEVRTFIREFIKPGMMLSEICTALEEKVREIVKPTPWGYCNGSEQILARGHGFPTGLSLNHIAAHFTPNPDDAVMKCNSPYPLVYTENDIMKVDFGVHVRGRIVDSAFSVAENPKFETLKESTVEGTNVGIKCAGVDVKLKDIGAEIEEVIRSYEYVEVDGRCAKQIVPISNLCGHSMEAYVIHAGKSVPIVDNGDETRMLAGEFYAIETFASTGRGIVEANYECSHYMRKREVPSSKAVQDQLAHDGARVVWKVISHNFTTLPFCTRWIAECLQIEDNSKKKTKKSKPKPASLYAGLWHLVNQGVVEKYPPLCDLEGSFISQMEHTIVLSETSKEVVSRGDDY